MVGRVCQIRQGCCVCFDLNKGLIASRDHQLIPRCYKTLFSSQKYRDHLQII